MDAFFSQDRFYSPRPGQESTVPEYAAPDPLAAPPFGGPSSDALGVTRQTESCWEYSAVEFVPAEYEEIRIVSAWFGHPQDVSLRYDITQRVGVLLASAGFAAGGLAAGDRRDANSIEVGASVKIWGDPAMFCLKRLEVTYDLMWLTAEETMALSVLRKRATDKAITAPDLDELLGRLSSALLGVATPDMVECSGQVPEEGRHSESLPLGRTSPRWKQLGFQSSDPRSDLRTGRLALESLVYLVEHYPLAAGQMVRESQQDAIDYPFAVASINVTQLLARYLSLVTCKITSSAACNHEAPRGVVRAFAQVLCRDSREEESFGELHAAVMARLHTTWRALKTRNAELTIMDFPQALEATMSVVHEFFLSRPLQEATDFRGISQFEMLSDDSEVPVSIESSTLESLRSVADSVTETAGVFGEYFKGVMALGPRQFASHQDESSQEIVTSAKEQQIVDD